jgi:1-acyl-sn-glycerol-3-phosphate acyltransferase
MRDALVRPSRRLLSLFAIYLHWYVGRHFRAIRVANAGRFPKVTGPLIAYTNHASWWDPLALILFSRYFLPTSDHYGPMDATALKQYGFFRKLGLFPIEPETSRGAAQFLRAAKEILSRPHSVLWVTPEGRFTDMRTRPVAFRTGLAALVARLGACTLVPMAAEYTFWDERLPEILICCGQPIKVNNGRRQSTEEWNEELCAAMAATQDELAVLAKLRNPENFETILSGRLGISGVYGGWKRLLALLTGRDYQESHGSIHRP